MENLIKEVFEKKMADGSIEAIINKKIEELVSSSCDSLFRWDGLIKKQMEAKLKEIMGNVLEYSDFSNYTIKLTTLINSILPETALEDYKNIGESIKAVCGTKVPEYKEKVKLTEIFENYVKYIEDETFSRDDFEDTSDIDEGSGHINCYMEYDNYEGKVTFKIEGVENADEYEKVIKIDRISGDYHISRRNFKSMELNDLRHADKFELYLMVLSNCYAKLDIDKEETEDTASVEVDYS